MSGELSEVPFFSSQPESGTHGIALEPDGDLWATGYSFATVRHLSVTGAITRYDLRDAVSYPAGIVLGPDTAIWFTELFGDRIGRISPMGNLVEYPLATDAGPRDIIVGRDGNLWFTEAGVDKIGRISLDQ